jgi:hypothetical protein
MARDEDFVRFVHGLGLAAVRNRGTRLV